MGPPGPHANSTWLIFSASERLTLTVLIDAGIEFSASILAHEFRNLWVVVANNDLTQIVQQFDYRQRLLCCPIFVDE